ncbi:recombinase family protein, partial [Alicyclobacillus ferrooxydans]
MNQVNSPIKVAIYTRVSTEEQAKEGFSLKAQEGLLRQYAQNRGYVVYDVYCDDGYSGKDFNRPEIQRLFRDLYSENFNGILVKSVDRVSRRMSDISKLLDDVLLPNNCRLLVSDNNLDSSELSGTMFINFLGTFAQYERSLIIDRVKTGMTKRAELGFWNGGVVLGYDHVNKRLVINEGEADIIRRIFNLRAQGKGYKSIAEIVNEEGYRTKNDNLFGITAIKTILENPVYIGKCKWGRRRDWSVKRRKGVTEDYILVDGKHESIIPLELWINAQSVSCAYRESASKNRNFHGEFVLSGILRCPQCGAGTVMSKSKKRDGSGYHLYYMCQAFHSKGKKACKSNLIPKDLIERKVVQQIRELIRNEAIVENVVNRITGENDKALVDVKNSITAISKRLGKQKIHLDKLTKDYFDERISPEAYNELSERVRKEVTELQLQRSQLDRKYEEQTSHSVITKRDVMDALSNFDVLYDKASNEEKKSLIRAVIKKIEVEPNRKDIKKITFWFDYDDALLLSKTGGTV